MNEWKRKQLKLLKLLATLIEVILIKWNKPPLFETVKRRKVISTIMMFILVSGGSAYKILKVMY